MRKMGIVVLLLALAMVISIIMAVGIVVVSHSILMMSSLDVSRCVVMPSQGQRVHIPSVSVVKGARSTRIDPCYALVERGGVITQPMLPPREKRLWHGVSFKLDRGKYLAYLPSCKISLTSTFAIGTSITLLEDGIGIISIPESRVATGEYFVTLRCKEKSEGIILFRFP